MKNVTTVFNKSMKMSDLIDADCNLLLLLLRLNIPLGFGDKSVETVCQQNGFDVNCFLFLANFQSSKSIINVEEEFGKLRVEPFLYYLRSSHDYFLKDRLPNIRRKLQLVFAPEEKDLSDVIMNFFDNYVKEVYDHMTYEDEVVFPYIYSLLKRTNNNGYNIGIFEERHNNIENEVEELKRILMKYLPGMKNQRLITNILLELFTTQEELGVHTFIEDNLVVPRIREIEKEQLK
ncbi:hemerythrin domain-containing protein [Dysgonomonas sp. 216]|uniref:hemerythrin domain-containing protein n=1 Tax=Dysgonomonas sp. 216 TaxID=2302934 RepID=UPI0013D7F1EB|nr:hemerythrin domain-containing protein [Dysgonomonas sp. 216]NDW17526.1 hemerythrin domain-containing protein [Dysgonomonas sp. 216]